MLLFRLRDFLWGLPIVSLLIVSGGYFTVATKFFQFRPIHLLKRTIGSIKKNTPDKKKMIASVSTALGGTVGVGSITGVTLGISVGGAGSVFWMWVSGLTGMALKYAEVYLAVKHRKKLEDGNYAGGAPYALADCGHPFLGILFAVFTIFASFGVGNLTQINALSECAKTIGVSKHVFCFLCAALMAIVVFGGQDRIGTVSTFLIPPAAILYITAVLWIVLLNLDRIPYAFFRILTEAFGIRPVVGGISGMMISQSMREGFARGVFSNEAGVGSSPLAHASSGEGDPTAQGLWGSFEILVDTFLISTLTALALLSTGQNSAPELFRMQFGTIGVMLFAVLMTFFAFSSILSWCYYADVCLTFLKIPYCKTVYRICSVLTAFIGAYASTTLFWCLADILNAMMMLPNLFLLFLRRKDVRGP